MDSILIMNSVITLYSVKRHHKVYLYDSVASETIDGSLHSLVSPELNLYTMHVV